MKAALNMREMPLGNGEHQKKTPRKLRLPVYGTEIFAELVRQTSTNLSRTDQRVPACGQGTGTGGWEEGANGRIQLQSGQGLGEQHILQRQLALSRGRSAPAGRGGKL